MVIERFKEIEIETKTKKILNLIWTSSVESYLAIRVFDFDINDLHNELIEYTKIKTIKFDDDTDYILDNNNYGYRGRILNRAINIFNNLCNFYIPNKPYPAYATHKEYIMLIAPMICELENAVKFELNHQLTFDEGNLW